MSRRYFGGEKSFSDRIPAGAGAIYPVHGMGQSPVEDEGADLVAWIQLAPGATAGAVVNVTIEWAVGETNFSRIVRASPVARPVVISGARRIELRAQLDPSCPAGVTYAYTVRVAAVEGRDPGPQAWAGTWFGGGVAADVSSQLAPLGGGMILALQGTLVAIGVGGPAFVYAMAFDSPLASGSVPANGTAPMAGAVSAPLAPGDAFGADDELAPATAFAAGLLVALSTTPDTYTAPPAGTTATFAAKVSS